MPFGVFKLTPQLEEFSFTEYFLDFPLYFMKRNHDSIVMFKSLNGEDKKKKPKLEQKEFVSAYLYLLKLGDSSVSKALVE